MKRLMIPAFAVLVFAAAVVMLRSPTAIDIVDAAAAMPPLHELHAMVGVNKLPVQDVEDQSLVYPVPTKP